MGPSGNDDDAYIRALENFREAVRVLDRDTAQKVLISALAEHVAYDDRYDDDPANLDWSAMSPAGAEEGRPG
jgi:hypothetical protein